MKQTLINGELLSSSRNKINQNFTELYERMVSINWKSVKEFGALGDGLTDDTIAIQSLINSINDGDTLYFPKGIYMIKATGDNATGSDGGLNITKSISIVLDNGAILKAIDGQKTYGQIIHVTNVNSFELIGGSFIGDKDTRITPCENCNSLFIEDSSNVYIYNTNFSQSAGDGIRVSRNIGSSKNIKISTCVFDNFSRWGISADIDRNLKISDCIFKDANGEYSYGGGIDIEYECNLISEDTVMRNITISDCDFQNIGTLTKQRTGTIVINPTASKNYDNVVLRNISMSDCVRGINVFNAKNFKITESNFDAGGYSLTIHGSQNGWNWGIISKNSFVNNALLNIGDSALATDYIDGLIISENQFDNSYIRFNYGTTNSCHVSTNSFKNLGTKIPIDVVSGHTANNLIKSNNINVDTASIIN